MTETSQKTRINFVEVVHRVATIYDIPKFVLSFLSGLPIKMF